MCMEHTPFQAPTHTCAHPATGCLLGSSLSLRETWDPPPHFQPAAGQPLLPFPEGTLGVSRSSTHFEHDGVASRGSSCDSGGCEVEGMLGSEDSRGQGVPSEADLRTSLPPSFFSFMKLINPLAPIQWGFLVRSGVLKGHSQPTLNFQQVTGCPNTDGVSITRWEVGH